MKSRYTNILLLLLGISGSVVHAAAPRDLIAQGNAHYAAGQYAEALESYRRAAEALHGAPGAELLHDLAAAHFKLGDLNEARELWVRALPLQDAAFEARTRYNLGNCDYAAALRALQAQPPSAADVPVGRSDEALALLSRAMEQYRDAVRLDPGLSDARANLELAYRLKQEIERSTTPQPQPSEDEETESQCDQQQPRSQPSPESQPGEGESEQPEQAGEPPETRSQTQEPPTPPPDPATQPDKEPEASATDQGQEVPPPQELDHPPPEQPAAMIQMSREEAERLLQMIRDAEKARRRVLREREVAAQRPVDRDW